MYTHNRVSARNSSSLSETFKFWRRHNKNGYVNVLIFNTGLIILPRIQLKFVFIEFSQKYIIVKKKREHSINYGTRKLYMNAYLSKYKVQISYSRREFFVISSGPLLLQENMKFVNIKI